MAVGSYREKLKIEHLLRISLDLAFLVAVCSHVNPDLR